MKLNITKGLGECQASDYWCESTETAESSLVNRNPTKNTHESKSFSAESTSFVLQSTSFWAESKSFGSLSTSLQSSTQLDTLAHTYSQLKKQKALTKRAFH
ncbi:hypothetical protein AWM68_12405 [Fictibacillus phosphorivorans]|uniref:Uncharacterized protein n=1 Tax=Fictibacillus phosphorivorans TaxID=1221500 RepID=A0A168CRG4_9BACL|nr:hypothetical protein [Fictibacillus phosphorivorans]KZE63908.1 hypothetical protein AWM68_12405 [Fictibacillus phosphorivorans]